MQLASRQGDGRVVGAELHALRQGKQAGLRHLGEGRKSGLGFQRRSPLLQEVRRQPESVPGEHLLSRFRRLSDSSGWSAFVNIFSCFKIMKINLKREFATISLKHVFDLYKGLV